MDEEEYQPESEKPRFLLLPDGCKDLTDAIRLRQQIDATRSFQVAAITSGLSEPMPASVVLLDPVAIGDLASALHLKPHKIISWLIQFKVFASTSTYLDFDTASAICASYGVAATKAA